MIRLIGKKWKWFRIKYYKWSDGIALWGLYRYLEDMKDYYDAKENNEYTALNEESLRELIRNIF